MDFKHNSQHVAAAAAASSAQQNGTMAVSAIQGQQIVSSAQSMGASTAAGHVATLLQQQPQQMKSSNGGISPTIAGKWIYLLGCEKFRKFYNRLRKLVASLIMIFYNFQEQRKESQFLHPDRLSRCSTRCLHVLSDCFIPKHISGKRTKIIQEYWVLLHLSIKMWSFIQIFIFAHV